MMKLRDQSRLTVSDASKEPNADLASEVNSCLVGKDHRLVDGRKTDGRARVSGRYPLPPSESSSLDQRIEQRMTARGLGNSNIEGGTIDLTVKALLDHKSHPVAGSII